MHIRRSGLTSAPGCEAGARERVSGTAFGAHILVIAAHCPQIKVGLRIASKLSPAVLTTRRGSFI